MLFFFDKVNSQAAMTIFMIDYEYLFDAIYIFKSVRLYSNRIQLFT